MALLEVKGLTKQFGGLVALKKVDLEVETGQIKGLIGPNGAGKTTLFNVITGFFPATEGSATFEGKNALGRKPHRVTKLGIARTFQNIRLFANMTALENVMVGVDARHHVSVPGAIIRIGRQEVEERPVPDGNRRPWNRAGLRRSVVQSLNVGIRGLNLLTRSGREDKETPGMAHEFLKQVGIGHLANEISKNLSYGDQRRVEIARALGTRPSLLLLDEPAAGMNPAEKAALMQLIRKIRDSGVTILLIEHDMKVVMGICEEVSVLDFGVKIAEGPPEAVQSDTKVIEAYLGAGAAGGRRNGR